MAEPSVIAGRYQIEGRLGVGGMSTVHLAFDQRLERHVALKLLAEHLADDSAFVSRFRREALAAARLVHPNIVQVFDFGLDERQHQHFIVMEHVPGQSCAEILRDQGHLDVDQAVEIVAQSCRGLDYAHRHGVVHRDVKPGNLLVSDSDVVKLADFGIARATDQSSITQVGSVLGTAAYLSPEQARGEEAGPRADIYSLGVVTYQLLSGRLPYEANSLSELALKQQREAPPPLEDVNDRVPPELADAVASALSIEQEDRPPDAPTFAETLRSGERGIAPPRFGGAPGTGATRVMTGRGTPTEATRVAPGTARTVAAPSAPRRLEPRPYGGDVRGRGQHARAPLARPPERRRGRAFALFFLFAVIIVAVVAAIVISTDTAPTVVRARNFIAHGFQDAYNQLSGWINQYTK
jgi:eukaryotic-like serine/threonine-protein kinase